jgi:phytoene dehydrogenase-like protein
MAESRWDTVVIGAGVGGLVAAGILARAGRKVLVLERNRHSGGTAASYSRGGFYFPMGPLGFSSPRVVQTGLERMSAPMPTLERARYLLHAFGLRLPLSLPLAQLRDRLRAAFPADAQGVSIFFEQVERLGRAVDRLEDPVERALLERAALAPAGDYLRDLILDPALRRVLGSLGAREPYSGLPLLAAMWRLMCLEGIWKPQGGMDAFVGSLAAAAEAAGAEMLLGAEASAIEIERGRARGVAIAGGETIPAGAVISNADYQTTFLRLVDDRHLSDEFFQAVFNARPTGSILQVALGLDASAVDLSAFAAADRIVYRREEAAEPDWGAAAVDPAELAGAELEISLWSRPEPGSNRASLVIRTEAEYAHFARYRPAPKQRLASYAGYKERLGRALAAEAERVAPGLTGAVRVLDVATPLTFEERGGRSGGSVAGWSWDFEDLADFTGRELVRTPIAGLFLAGCQAYSGLFLGGVPTAVLSGVKAAEAVLAGAAPVETVSLPGGQRR